MFTNVRVGRCAFWNGDYVRVFFLSFICSRKSSLLGTGDRILLVMAEYPARQEFKSFGYTQAKHNPDKCSTYPMCWNSSFILDLMKLSFLAVRSDLLVRLLRTDFFGVEDSCLCQILGYIEWLVFYLRFRINCKGKAATSVTLSANQRICFNTQINSCI